MRKNYRDMSTSLNGFLYVKIAINMVLFPFYCLTFTLCHFLGESLLAMLTDIADASRTV